MITPLYSISLMASAALLLAFSHAPWTDRAPQKTVSDIPERVFLAAALDVDPADFTPLELISLAAGRTPISSPMPLNMQAPLSEAERAAFSATIQRAKALKQSHIVRQAASSVTAISTKCAA